MRIDIKQDYGNISINTDFFSDMVVFDYIPRKNGKFYTNITMSNGNCHALSFDMKKEQDELTDKINKNFQELK